MIPRWKVKTPPADAGDGRADGEGRELVGHRRDALRAHQRFVLLDGDQGAADARAAQRVEEAEHRPPRRPRRSSRTGRGAERVRRTAVGRRQVRECRAGRASGSTQSRAISVTSSAKVSVAMTKAWRLVRRIGIADHQRDGGVEQRRASDRPIQKLPPKVIDGERGGVAADAPEAELGEGEQAGEAVDEVERRGRDREDQRRDAQRRRCSSRR